tara:strand:+ start:4328 stop:4597 length:270 start_codon:yes stop_codon:yes gene_type:complete
MKVSVELFGAARDFSNKSHIDFELIENSSIGDLREKMIKFIEIKFNGNENYKKIISSSAFCSSDDKIVSDNYKIDKNQNFSIIPPIGGG